MARWFSVGIRALDAHIKHFHAKRLHQFRNLVRNFLHDGRAMARKQPLSGCMRQPGAQLGIDNVVKPGLRPGDENAHGAVKLQGIDNFSSGHSCPAQWPFVHGKGFPAPGLVIQHAESKIDDILDKGRLRAQAGAINLRQVRQAGAQWLLGLVQR